MRMGTGVSADAVLTTPCRYGTMSLFRHDNTIGRSLLTYGEWAQSEIDLLLRLLPSGSRVIIDAGANIGTHTLAFSANAGPDGRVYAFEAHPQVFFLLSENLRHGERRNVDARNLGLSDADDPMFVSELVLSGEGNFGHVEVHTAPAYDRGAPLEIAVTTIDALGLDWCDLIKVDVEGMELQVLRGASETLRRQRPIVYAECLSVDSGAHVMQFLRDAGYDVWIHQARSFNPDNWLGSRENIFGLARESNLLAVPTDRSSAVWEVLSSEPSLHPADSVDSLARALYDTPRWSLAQWESQSSQALSAQLWRLHEDKVRLEEHLREANRSVAVARQDAARAARELKREDSGRLESQLREERAERVRIVSELEADARALIVQLDATREAKAGLLSWMRRGATPGAELRAVRYSRFSRAVAHVQGALGVLVMVSRSGSWHAVARSLKRLAANPRRISDAAAVASSDLFDWAYYVERNPDVVHSSIYPLLHYVLWGAFEDRRPNALFDPAYYLQQYPDVARAGFEPLSHFATHGTSEERDPGPHFDSRYYLAANPEVREAGVNPLTHFLQGGWRDGRNPSPSFDCASYVARYDDVRVSGINPLVHYLEVGRAQGRDAVPAAVAKLPAQPRVRLRSRQISAHRTASTDRPLIVCLTHVCPWPPHAGNSYRIYRMLRWLRLAGFGVIPLIVPLGGEAPSDDAIREVELMFSNVVVVDRGGDVRYTLTDVPDVLASLDGEPTPRYSAVLGEESPVSGRARELLTIDRTYCPDAAIAALLRLHSVLGHYVLLTEYVWMARALPLVGSKAIKVLDSHDVFSTKKDKVIRFGIRDLWLDPQEEARRLALADLVVAIQKDEQEILQQLVPDNRVITAGIDFDARGEPRLPQAPRVLYIASGNQLNARGLHDFLRFAWPSIREQVPTAEFLVAGAVSEALTEAQPGVRALGTVEDLDELYRSARVVINPALAGTGFKIKTVEALSYLRPIVTWPTGVDGLPHELRELCDIVRDWYEFGPRVIQRLIDGKEEAFSAPQRERIRQSTSPDVVYADLTSALEKLWRQRTAPAVAADADGGR